MRNESEKKTIRGLFIDPFKGTAEAIDADLGTLGKIHALLGCECFAIVGRPLLGADAPEFDVWHDDEGLLKGEEAMKPSVVAFSKKTGKPVEQIVGRAFICSHDDMGEPVSLSDMDIALLRSLLMRCTYLCDGKRGYVLTYAW